MIRFRNLLSEFAHNRIVLISTHIVSDVEYIATENAVMKQGKIIETGTTDELTQLVSGKVWSAMIPTREAFFYEQKMRVVNLRNEDHDMTSLRYLAETPLIPDSCPTEPKLEDLYLWLFPQEGSVDSEKEEVK